MGFLDIIPIISDAARGIQHASHQLNYHPESGRKEGIHLSNLTGSIGQGLSAFGEGFLGGAEKKHDDDIDTAFQIDEAIKRGNSRGDFQRQPGAAAYHYVT